MSEDHKLVIKDAARQLFGRVLSALFGFVIVKIISYYLGPLRYGDYGTIFRYFARRTALVDFGVYTIAMRQLSVLKQQFGEKSKELISKYHKFIGTRVFMITIIYTLAIVVAYLIPAYTENPFIIRGLPLAMFYSASNMFVGIQQLPLQLFWKMKRLSWSLIIARFSQLAVLLPVVYLFFKEVDFSNTEISGVMIVAFCLVVFSVVASALGQNVEIYKRTQDLLPFKVDIDKQFTKNLLQKNRRYGFSYFFSSFHTLIVLMFLGWIFPTAAGFKYVGFRALALSLIEMLLIIPSSLGNSLLNKLPNYSLEGKKKSIGNLLTMVTRIGTLIAINFFTFGREVIRIVSSKEFIGTRESLTSRGSNQILPFLGIVLVLSFVKQVFNYLFVATEKQNVLFNINLIGLIIGVIVGIIVIPKRNLLGGVITQIIIELLFTAGAILVAKKHKLLPTMQKKQSGILFTILLLAGIIGVFLKNYLESQELNFFLFIVIAVLFNGIILLAALKPIKQIAKGLTVEEIIGNPDEQQIVN
ncbi:MAG: hypothetical protein PHU61_00335 [Candidatus Absconditabacteria bacterium]|nr:hypothetical protein [Candidatus Absconditabacteria bacterium]MDD3868624.1 hypothetical protein [Candidatus Absconditabacteria bacterium]MDD4714144.1 hypothetical protein [Candidatus Absconditabacteria bacterium]